MGVTIRLNFDQLAKRINHTSDRCFPRQRVAVLLDIPDYKQRSLWVTEPWQIAIPHSQSALHISMRQRMRITAPGTDIILMCVPLSLLSLDSQSSHASRLDSASLAALLQHSRD